MKRFIALNLSLLFLFAFLVTPSYAASPKETTEDFQQFCEDVSEYFDNQIFTVTLAPGEIYSYEIPLSDGSVAYGECGVVSFSVFDSVEYPTGLGTSIFYNRVDGGIAGRLEHSVTYNVYQTSPVNYFNIVSTSVSGYPGTGFIVEDKNSTYRVYQPSNAVSDAYVSFIIPAVGVPVNVYSRIILSSIRAGVMSFGYYCGFTPFQ